MWPLHVGEIDRPKTRVDCEKDKELTLLCANGMKITTKFVITESSECLLTVQALGFQDRRHLFTTMDSGNEIALMMQKDWGGAR